MSAKFVIEMDDMDPAREGKVAAILRMMRLARHVIRQRVDPNPRYRPMAGVTGEIRSSGPGRPKKVA